MGQHQLHRCLPQHRGRYAGSGERGCDRPDHQPRCGYPRVHTHLARLQVPLSGPTQYDAVFTLDELTVDIDDLQDGDDGFDDPEITIPLAQSLEGVATAEATGCGEWELGFPIEESITVTIEKQQFLSLLNIQCDTLAIPNRAHCDALLFAASALDDGIDVTVGAAKLRNQADKAFENAVGSDFCTLN